MTCAPFPPGPALPEAQAILTIDLGALAENWRRLRARSAPAECGAVVKANAYGIGIEPAVRTLLKAGCKTFFVAHGHEGARVRAVVQGVENVAVYALNGLLPGADCKRALIDNGIRPVIGSLAELQDWIAGGAHHTLGCALHFNTGMNRLGLDTQDLHTVRDLIKASGTRVDLLMSHFVSSEEHDDPRNVTQIAAFENIRSVFGGYRASLANSSGILLPQAPHYDLVRPGYALYGGNPVPGSANPMKGVITLEAPVIQLREIAAGDSVGYNAQWTAKRTTRLATIGVGYADGFPRAAMATDTRPGAQAFVSGVICPFAGRVSMDLIVIDVTDVPKDKVAPGSMVELIGEHISIDDLGARAHTIGYEILTALGSRYHRRYIEPA